METLLVLRLFEQVVHYTQQPLKTIGLKNDLRWNWSLHLGVSCGSVL